MQIEITKKTISFTAELNGTDISQLTNNIVLLDELSIESKSG